MGETRGRLAVVVALGVVSLTAGALAGSMMSPTEPKSPVMVSSTSTATSPSSPQTLSVHVSGMVVSPGVVDVPVDAIVADAIEAAGGLRGEARVDLLNLAAPLSHGEHIVVPGPNTPEGVLEGPVVGEGDGPISLSDADATQLERLPGVGPVLAERIVAFREANGPFTVVEDLLEVPGIGEAKLAALRDLVQP